MPLSVGPSWSDAAAAVVTAVSVGATALIGWATNRSNKRVESKLETRVDALENGMNNLNGTVNAIAEKMGVPHSIPAQPQLQKGGELFVKG